MDLTKHHYMVYRRRPQDGIAQLTACYETSQGAVAHMAKTGIWYRIEIHPRSSCPRCTPFWDSNQRRAASAATSDQATPTGREFVTGTDYADHRGVYSKQAPAHSHVCVCKAVWGSCYRDDCWGDSAERLCPWHARCRLPSPEVNARRVMEATRLLDQRFPGWVDDVIRGLADEPQPQ